jgi:alanine racemase
VTRPAWAEVDLGAVADNVRLLVERAAPAQVCAVVKAGGYGHGSVEVAKAALAAGATWLAVAIPAEGVELREAGIDAPILLLAEFHDCEATVRHRLTPTVYSEHGITWLAAEARRQGRTGIGVHLKVDTGMHRIGAAPGEAVTRAKAVLAAPELELEAVWTHCPVADEPDNPYTPGQAARFLAVLDELRAAGIDPPMVHAANSAGTLAHPSLHHDLVRPGIAVYGQDPSPALTGSGLRPALSLKARVSHVQVVPAGDAVSYGLRRPMERDTVVATVPLGYADGVPRGLSDAGHVLVGGKRRRIAGTITMDQLMVECGDDHVAVGDEVVLLGRQGTEEIPVSEWATILGTIVYEITCGISLRVPRVYV